MVFDPSSKKYKERVERIRAANTHAVPRVSLIAPEKSQTFKKYGDKVIDINLISTIKRIAPDKLSPEGTTIVYLKEGAPYVTLDSKHDKKLMEDIKYKEE